MKCRTTRHETTDPRVHKPVHRCTYLRLASRFPGCSSSHVPSLCRGMTGRRVCSPRQLMGDREMERMYRVCRREKEVLGPITTSDRMSGSLFTRESHRETHPLVLTSAHLSCHSAFDGAFDCLIVFVSGVTGAAPGAGYQTRHTTRLSSSSSFFLSCLLMATLFAIVSPHVLPLLSLFFSSLALLAQLEQMEL